MLEHLRRSSRWVATVWLVGQLVAIVAPTVILRAAAASPRAVAVAEHCECTGTEGLCPMHPRSPRSPEGGQCAMRSCTIPDAALFATTTIAGVMPQVAVPHDTGAPEVLLTHPDLPVHRSDSPDLPPPRA